MNGEIWQCIWNHWESVRSFMLYHWAELQQFRLILSELLWAFCSGCRVTKVTNSQLKSICWVCLNNAPKIDVFIHFYDLVSKVLLNQKTDRKSLAYQNGSLKKINNSTFTFLHSYTKYIYCDVNHDLNKRNYIDCLNYYVCAFLSCRLLWKLDMVLLSSPAGWEIKSCGSGS